MPTVTEELDKGSNNAEGSDISLPVKIIKAYSRDVDMKMLGQQPDLMSAYKSYQHLKLSMVTTIDTIYDMLQAVPTAQELFYEVDKLLQIYLTSPVTTATAEQSISSLHRVTFIQQCLNKD